MKLISISTDTKIFDPKSVVYDRMKKYGTVFDELHIVVFSLRKFGYKKTQISRNVWVYPTNSFYKIAQVMDAFIIARKIYKNISESKDVVVSVQDPFETGMVGWMLKSFLGLRLNVQVHTDLYNPAFGKHSLLNRIRVFVSPIILTSADSIRVVSRRVKDSLVKKGLNEDRITTLPIFIDKDKYNRFQDVARKEDTLLAVSRLTKEKNLFFLVDVMDEVVRTKPKAELVIVGDGPIRKDLELYIKEKKLDKNIRLVGWTENVAKWYQEAGVFVHTSLYEGYGMVFVEAALQRVPIVSSSVGIMGDVFENDKSALICLNSSAECFVKKILEILTDRERTQKIADLAFKKVMEHLHGDIEQYLTKYKESI